MPESVHTGMQNARQNRAMKPAGVHHVAICVADAQKGLALLEGHMRKLVSAVAYYILCTYLDSRVARFPQ
jgi:hypothetical protein